jgi:putative Holliday junction resolvase
VSGSAPPVLTEEMRSFLDALSPSGRLAGLDYGEARIGLAQTDPLRLVVSPLPAYRRRSTRKDVGFLAARLREIDAAGLVAGWPLALCGDETEGCAEIARFCRRLQEKIPLPILLRDERLSTAAAARMLKEAGFSRRASQARDDSVAAAFVLQGVVEGMRSAAG